MKLMLKTKGMTPDRGFHIETPTIPTLGTIKCKGRCR